MSTPAAMGPSCAPLRGTSTTSRSTAFRYEAHTHAIRTRWCAAGYGYTGTLPAAQSARVVEPRIERVTRSYASAGSRRATAWSTKRWRTASTRRRSASENRAVLGVVTTCAFALPKRCDTCGAVFGYETPTPTAVPTSTTAMPAYVRRLRRRGDRSRPSTTPEWCLTAVLPQPAQDDASSLRGVGRLLDDLPAVETARVQHEPLVLRAGVAEERPRFGDREIAVLTAA